MDKTFKGLNGSSIQLAAGGGGRANVSKPAQPQQFGQQQVALPTNNIIPDDFVITMDNSAGGSNVVYRVGDPTGAYTIAIGGSPTAASYNYTGLTNTTLNNWLLAGIQLKIVGLTLNTTDDADQFNQNFMVYSGLWNNIVPKNISTFLSEAENPMAQNPYLIKPIFRPNEYLPLDCNNAWFVTVLAGQKLTIKVRISDADAVYTQSLTSRF